MSSNKKLSGVRDLTDQELAGFVRLLLAGERLPLASPEILAYLERVAGQIEIDESSVLAAVRGVKSNVVRERLWAAHPQPIRPLGTHLLAKRTEASCKLADVAILLGENTSHWEAVESRVVSGLGLGIEKLARIAEVFGLHMSELRQALLLDAAHSGAQRSLGPSFARSREGEFKLEALRIAADDLRRAKEQLRGSPEASVEESIDTAVRGVRLVLEEKGLHPLTDG